MNYFIGIVINCNHALIVFGLYNFRIYYKTASFIITQKVISFLFLSLVKFALSFIVETLNTQM